MVGCAIDQHCLRTNHPINLSFTKSGGALAVQWCDPDRFPNLVYITSDFRWKQFGVYALHALLIQLYAICWHARRCFVIFRCRIIPVHGFRYRATRPRSYSLDNAVKPLRDAVTFWVISTPVLHSYAPFVCESEATKSWNIICQYFNWRAAFKEDGLQFSHDDRRILTCQLAPHSETCRPAIDQRQESIATGMGYVHCEPIPVFFPLLFFPFPNGAGLGQSIGSLRKFVLSIWLLLSW